MAAENKDKNIKTSFIKKALGTGPFAPKVALLAISIGIMHAQCTLKTNGTEQNKTPPQERNNQPATSPKPHVNF